MSFRQPIARKLGYMTFQPVVSAFSPVAEMQCLTGDGRAALLWPLDLALGLGHAFEVSLLSTPTTLRLVGVFFEHSDPSVPTFLSPALSLKLLDLNTEKPNVPWVPEPHHSGGIHRVTIHPTRVAAFYTAFDKLLFIYFDYFF